MPTDVANVHLSSPVIYYKHGERPLHKHHTIRCIHKFIMSSSHNYVALVVAAN